MAIKHLWLNRQRELLCVERQPIPVRGLPAHAHWKHTFDRMLARTMQRCHIYYSIMQTTTWAHTHFKEYCYTRAWRRHGARVDNVWTSCDVPHGFVQQGVPYAAMAHQPGFDCDWDSTLSFTQKASSFVFKPFEALAIINWWKPPRSYLLAVTWLKEKVVLRIILSVSG